MLLPSWGSFSWDKEHWRKCTVSRAPRRLSLVGSKRLNKTPAFRGLNSSKQIKVDSVTSRHMEFIILEACRS